ncbi:MAG: hypothetical protein WCE23_05960 [Candidatus Binatus sp.]|uniref:hypothetical protein n=1 Tax=Candidatus Binatus sp. TaxID=2811406 RepID=UPI003C73B253
MRVAEGTASVGCPQQPTALLRRPLDRFDAGQLRILGPLKVGDRFEECDAFLTKDAMGERVKVITDELELILPARHRDLAELVGATRSRITEYLRMEFHFCHIVCNSSSNPAIPLLLLSGWILDSACRQ